MRTTDERMAAVRRRSGRMRRRRADAGLAALVCLLALPLADLVSRHATAGLAPSSTAETGLFGASSLLGPSAGGNVLVAVASFAAAVVVTALVILRRHAADDGEHERDGGEVHHEKTR